MPTLSTRLLFGFAAGFLAHLLFQGALGVLLHANGLLGALPWSLEPTAPLGVPRTLSVGFWAGLWGGVFALLEPKLTARLGYWAGGILFAYALPLMGHWFVAQPLKGFGVGGGFNPAVVPIELAFTLAFGFGTAFTYWAGLTLAGHRGSPSPARG